MTDSEVKEYVELIRKWNCSDITPEQEARLNELERKTSPVLRVRKTPTLVRENKKE